ncbi:MAG: hypothetical protein MZU97_17315 [Bacillus subtilis]|nr:hypothetical protein [Bacillus subtilis]
MIVRRRIRFLTETDIENFTIISETRAGGHRLLDRQRVCDEGLAKSRQIHYDYHVDGGRRRDRARSSSVHVFPLRSILRVLDHHRLDVRPATAPAATLLVMRQYRAKGPVDERRCLPVVALDDVYGIAAFGIAASASR